MVLPDDSREPKPTGAGHLHLSPDMNLGEPNRHVIGESTTSTFESAPADEDENSKADDNRTSDFDQLPHDIEAKFDSLRRGLATSATPNSGLLDIVQQLHEHLLHLNGLNLKLAQDLARARTRTAGVDEQDESLEQRSPSSGIFLQTTRDGCVYVFANGHKIRANVSPRMQVSDLRPGQLVVLDKSLNVVFAQSRATVGELVTLKETLPDNERALVVTHADEERVVKLADSLKGEPLRSGDSLLLEPGSGYVFERTPRKPERWLIDEIPRCRL